jgi:hypothetical protein
VVGEARATKRGLKQGCPLSPIVFNLLLQYVLDHANLGTGVRITAHKVLDNDMFVGQNGGFRLQHLCFADDIALAAESVEEAHCVLMELNEVFARFGLKMNQGKTKYMPCDWGLRTADGKLKPKAIPNPPDALLVGGKPVDRVETFRYLGSVLHEDGDDDADISDKLRLGSWRFSQLRRLFFSKKLEPSVKYRLLVAFVYPAVSYSAESWNLKADQIRRLDAWWMQKIRICCGVTKFDHYRNEQLLMLAKAEKLSELIRRRRRRYLGHIIRYPEERWVRKMLTASVAHGPPPRGNTKTTWAEFVRNEMHQLGASYRDALKIKGPQGHEEPNPRWRRFEENELLQTASRRGRARFVNSVFADRVRLVR